jgi:quinol monooxygenase YgiN
LTESYLKGYGDSGLEGPDKELQMAIVLVRHKVTDYARWKIGYTEHGASRKKGGCTGARVLRSVNDPNEVVVMTEWPDMAKARAFAEDPGLKDAMAKAGVADRPDIFFLEEAEVTPF